MTDTGTETVERLARCLDNEAAGWPNMYIGDLFTEAARSIRALAAERDALRADLRKCRMEAVQDGCVIEMYLEEIAELRARITADRGHGRRGAGNRGRADKVERV